MPFQVYERVKAPLLTLSRNPDSPEVAYVVIAHLHLLVHRAPYLFSTDYRAFYCKHIDPPCTKRLKLEILTGECKETR